MSLLKKGTDEEQVQNYRFNRYHDNCGFHNQKPVSLPGRLHGPRAQGRETIFFGSNIAIPTTI